MNPIVFIAALIGLGAPALAQTAQATPENAHNFLSKIAAQGGMALGMKLCEGFNQCASDNLSVAAADTSVDSYTATSPCVAEVAYQSGVGGSWLFEPARKNPAGGFIWVVEWSRIGRVEAQGASVVLNQARGLVYRMTFLSPEFAARAALAMETIRQSCDTTSGTGF